MKPTSIDINFFILEHALCLEPEVGEDLLPFYPEFLSPEKKAQFELHLEGCEFCQERWKLWQATGLALRVEAILNQAKDLLQHRQYAEAIARYNHALAIAPEIFETADALEFLQHDAWMPLNSARSKTRDISLFVVPNHEPGAQVLAAASVVSAFPITLEYDQGNVMLKISALGRFIFSELVHVSQEFEAGIQVVGKEASVKTALRTWTLLPGKKYKLGAIDVLFGSADFADIVRTLRTFRVFPLQKE